MSNNSLFLVVNLQRVCPAFVAHLSDFYMKSSIKRLWTNCKTASDFVQQINQNRQVILTGAASVKKETILRQK